MQWGIALKPNIIAKIILLSFSSVVLIGTFQNCAQSSGSAAFTPTNSGNAIGNENTDSLEKVDNVDLSNADFILISLRSLYADANQRRSAKDIQNLQINLNNGEMKVVDTDGSILDPVRLCMRRQELEEFKSILRSAKLCQPQTAGPREDIVCTQVYKYPFAWLQYSNGDKVKLGEVNGCTKSLDLCDEYRDVYNGFIAYIRNNLDNRKCL